MHTQVSQRLRLMISSCDPINDNLADAMYLLGGNFGVPCGYVFGYDVCVLPENKGGIFKYFWYVLQELPRKRRCVALRCGCH